MRLSIGPWQSTRVNDPHFDGPNYRLLNTIFVEIGEAIEYDWSFPNKGAQATGF